MKRTIVQKMKKALVVLMAVNMLLTFSNVSSVNSGEYGVMPCTEEPEETRIEYF